MAQNQTTGQKGVPLAPLDSLVECYRLVLRVAYLMESIEDPDAEIVKGYQPGIMSAAIKPHQVAEADARDLVAYIKSLK